MDTPAQNQNPIELVARLLRFGKGELPTGKDAQKDIYKDNPNKRNFGSPTLKDMQGRAGYGKLNPEQYTTLPPSNLSILLHTIKNTPDNTLSEKGKALMQGISLTSSGVMESIVNGLKPKENGDNFANRLIAGSAIASATMLPIMHAATLGNIAGRAAAFTAFLAAAGMLSGTISNVFDSALGLNEEQKTQEWVDRSKSVPSKHMESFLEGTSPNCRAAVIKTRAQDELLKVADLPKEKLGEAMKALPKFYGKSVLEVLLVNEKLDPMKIGKHNFPQDFLKVVSKDEQAKILKKRPELDAGMEMR